MIFVSCAREETMPSKCKTDNCSKEATYGPPEDRTRVACAKHKTEGMITKKKEARKCMHCDKRPTFAPPGEKPMYCKDHVPNEDMKNIYAKTCTVCHEKQPSYGLKDGKATHCAKCAKTSKDKDKLFDLVSVLCTYEGGCQKNATRGLVGGKPTYCAKHAPEEMGDIKNKKCEVCNEKQATYGIDKPTHCKEHKNEKMRDLRHNTEQCELCTTRATFGYDKPARCLKHMKDDMTDLISDLCNICNIRQPCFSYKPSTATSVKRKG